MPGHNDATASYLGYVFQGQYALLALWDAEDDDAAVSVETADDVELQGNDPRLAQLKHSTGSPAALTIANVGFWKTIRIWAAHLRGDPTAHATNTSTDRTKYLFVTVATLSSGDVLNSLLHGATRSDASLDTVMRALETEAARIGEERAVAAAAGEARPHTERAAGCEAFLALSDAERQRLVARIEILPDTFSITDVVGEVERRLKRAGSVRATIRRSVAERLIERWDRQVTLALMGRRNRAIRRSELLGIIEDLIREYGTTALPNDYGARQPDAAEYAAAEGSILERQVHLVDGGPARVQRAVRDRWRARNQRRRWTDDDTSLAPLLKAYDDLLKQEWGDRHGPMCDDCRGLDDDERTRRGLMVLDWAYSEAPADVPPPRPDWSDAFYVRGMLQQFADDLEVGWHPDYLERLGATPPVSAPVGATTSQALASGAHDGEADTSTPTSNDGLTPPVDLWDHLPPDRSPAPSSVGGDSRPMRARRSPRAKTE